VPIAAPPRYGASRIGVTLFTELRQGVFAHVMARASRDITLKVFHLHGLSSASPRRRTRRRPRRRARRAAITDLTD